MNHLKTLFIGFFLTFLFAWLGLVVFPYLQLGNLQPYVDEDEGTSFPLELTGIEKRGMESYARNGCIYCHTQQIRPKSQGSDIERGWGGRRTVARDYINQKPVFLGTMRTGPDLTNVGVRLRDERWHHEHLYNPQSKSSWSTMSPYKYLYEKRKIQGQPSPDALIDIGEEIEEGYEIVPKEEAKALVAYLLSLNRNYPLPEAPFDE
ncbi:MAG: cbb3-type cytochrome c oxidase subunit II [Verrucomicrobiota bacterium]